MYCHKALSAVLHIGLFLFTLIPPEPPISLFLMLPYYHPFPLCIGTKYDPRVSCYVGIDKVCYLELTESVPYTLLWNYMAVGKYCYVNS